MAPAPLPKVAGGQLSPAKRAQLAATASPSTPHRSPIKQRKAGVTLQQKKTLIENMRLEITERARRLRAQYHLQAQGLRSRIEIRLNRIPMSLRKLKMEDLLLKYMEQSQEQSRSQSHHQPQPQAQHRATVTRTKVALSPLKDGPTRTSPQKPSQQAVRGHNAGRPQKHSSDKENDVEHGETAKRRAVGSHAASVPISQVLSPTSSNTRMANRERITSPIKSQMLKSSSPIKFHGVARPDASSSSLSSAAEKARTVRAGGIRKVTSGSVSSSSGASRPRRAVAAPGPAGPRSAPRTTRRASGNSDTSESSTNTMVRKIVGGRSAAAVTKKMTGGGKKSMVGADEKISDSGKAKASGGRMLRKRA